VVFKAVGAVGKMRMKKITNKQDSKIKKGGVMSEDWRGER
jgi:hypothetical protein